MFIYSEGVMKPQHVEFWLRTELTIILFGLFIPDFEAALTINLHQFQNLSILMFDFIPRIMHAETKLNTMKYQINQFGFEIICFCLDT